MSTVTLKSQDINILNKHGDHIATCLCCIKLKGSLGEWGREEDGALDNPYINCDAGEFEFLENDNWSKAVAIIHIAARCCRLFDPND